MAARTRQEIAKLEELRNDPVVIFRKDAVRVATKFRVIEVSTIDGTVSEFCKRDMADLRPKAA